MSEALRTRPNSWTVGDTLRWTKGRHETSMGFDYRKQSLDKNFRWLLDPKMAFQGIHTGYGVADFFLGMPSSLTQMAYGEVVLQDFPAFAAFFQDNIRISPRFTLNIGVQYEPSIPYRDQGQPGQRFQTRR